MIGFVLSDVSVCYLKALKMTKNIIKLLLLTEFLYLYLGGPSLVREERVKV
jgi:hypothetical protein